MTGSSYAAAAFVSVTDSSVPKGLHARVNIVDLIEDAPVVAAPIAPVKKLLRKYVSLTFPKLPCNLVFILFYLHALV
jgi:hypothetical protein